MSGKKLFHEDVVTISLTRAQVYALLGAIDCWEITNDRKSAALTCATRALKAAYHGDPAPAERPATPAPSPTPPGVDSEAVALTALTDEQVRALYEARYPFSVDSEDDVRAVLDVARSIGAVLAATTGDPS